MNRLTPEQLKELFAQARAIAGEVKAHRERTAGEAEPPEGEDLFGDLPERQGEAEAHAESHYDPNEPRDPAGKWTDGRSGGKAGGGDNGGMKELKKVSLWRAADDDNIVGSASFSTSRDDAKAYLSNPGFGGRSLWKTEVEIDPDKFLDLHDDDHDDALKKIMDLTGLRDPGAIGIDEWVPRIADQLSDAGIEWVRVRESYPVDSETYIFVGGNEPELEEDEGDDA